MSGITANISRINTLQNIVSQDQHLPQKLAVQAPKDATQETRAERSRRIAAISRCLEYMQNVKSAIFQMEEENHRLHSEVDALSDLFEALKNQMSLIHEDIET